MSFSEYWRRAVRGEGGTAGTLLCAAAWPLSVAYGVAASFYRAAYCSGLLPHTYPALPTISVGSLVVGGAGKTTVTAYLARRIADAGGVPAVILRGYGGTARGPICVSNGAGALVGSEIAGDEAVLLAELCPGVAVFVGKRREQAIAEAGAAHANLAILDDGFQYFRMRRDMDILVVNALQRGPALRMFPAGILREPAHAIRCADQIWITHAQAVTKDKLQELVGWCRKRAPKAPIVITTHTICRFRGFMLGETVSPAGLTVVAFCGIGSPEAFRASLECSGVSTVELWPFPDHYRYTEMDLQLVAEWAQDKGADLVVTTAKDAVRIKKELWPDQAPPLVVADVALAVEQGIEYVEEVIKGWSRVPGRHAHYAGDPRAGRPSKK